LAVKIYLCISAYSVLQSLFLPSINTRIHPTVDVKHHGKADMAVKDQ
jgi:hypothetical protein